MTIVMREGDLSVKRVLVSETPINSRYARQRVKRNYRYDVIRDGEVVSEHKSKAGARKVLDEAKYGPKPKLSDLVKVGDIFVSSWGYDQTNVDYYEVVEMTDASVRIKGLMKGVLDGDGESHGIMHVAPIPGAYINPDAEPKLKRVDIYPGWREDQGWTVSLNLTSYSSAYLWDCKPDYQTHPQWGH